MQKNQIHTKLKSPTKQLSSTFNTLLHLFVFFIIVSLVKSISFTGVAPAHIYYLPVYNGEYITTSVSFTATTYEDIDFRVYQANTVVVCGCGVINPQIGNFYSTETSTVRVQVYLYSGAPTNYTIVMYRNGIQYLRVTKHIVQSVRVEYYQLQVTAYPCTMNLAFSSQYGFNLNMYSQGEQYGSNAIGSYSYLSTTGPITYGMTILNPGIYYLKVTEDVPTPYNLLYSTPQKPYSGSLQCTTSVNCPYYQVNENNACVYQCSSGKYPLNKICTPCSSNCLTCTVSGCLTCSPSYLLQNGQCISQCTSPNYYQSGNKCISITFNGNSPPHAYFVDVVPGDTINAYLTWDSTSDDIDLSLTQPDYNYYSGVCGCGGGSVFEDQTLIITQSGKMRVQVKPWSWTPVYYDLVIRKNGITMFITRKLLTQGTRAQYYSFDVLSSPCLMSLNFTSQVDLNLYIHADGTQYTAVQVTHYSHSGSSAGMEYNVGIQTSGTYILKVIEPIPSYYASLTLTSVNPYSGSLFCYPCSNYIQNCLSCSSKTTCTVCNSPFIQQSGSCVLTCSTGLTVQGNMCVPCQLNCQSCTNTTDCTQCNIPTYLQQKDCVYACDVGKYTLGQTCVSCSENCLVCSQFGCSRCSALTLLQDAKCVSECSLNHYQQGNQCLDKKFSGNAPAHAYFVPVVIGDLLYVQVNWTSNWNNIDVYVRQADLVTGSCGCNSSSRNQIVNENILTAGNARIQVNLISENNIFYTILIRKNGNILLYTTKLITHTRVQYFRYDVQNNPCLLSVNFTSSYDFKLSINMNQDQFADTQVQSYDYLQNSGMQQYNLGLFRQATYFLKVDDLIATDYNTTSEMLLKPFEGTWYCYPCSNYMSHCASCESKTTCDSCQDTYLLQEGICVQACSSGFFKFQNYCYRCGNDCVSCVNQNQCTTCASSRFLQNKVCVYQCSTGRFVNGLECDSCQDNCDQCTSSISCTTCSQGYSKINEVCSRVCAVSQYVQGSNCLQCTDTHCDTCTVSTCSICLENYYLQEGSCVSTCSLGYYQSSTNCLKCQTHCSECTSLQVCTSCSDSYLLQQGACLESCSSAFFVSTSNCLQCGTHCNSCESAATCDTCEGTYLLQEGACLSTCSTGYFARFSNCLKCQDNCNVCQSPTVCTTCADTYLLEEGTCRQSCSVTYFASNSNCLKCSLNCNQCSTAEICLTCANTYLLQQGVCQQNCALSYFVSDVNCLKCSSHCSTCSSAELCTVCDATYLLQEGSCVTSCSSNYYVSGLNCVKCSTHCQQCFSSEICSVCTATYFLQEGSCKQTCSLSYYVQDLNCFRCSAHCSSCTSANSCTTCADSYLLQQGTCVSSCSLTFYASGTNCMKCPSDCAICTSSSVCSTCSFPFFLQQSSCVLTCAAGYFLNNSNCIKCSNNCLTCSDLLTCTFCSVGQLKNGICVVQLDYTAQTAWPDLCKTGTLQSPINILPSNYPLCPYPAKNQFYFIMPNETFTFRPDGLNLKASFINKSKIEFVKSSVVYNFQSTEFSWHQPSEHTIRGVKLDLEWQIYHKQSNDSSKLAVVSLLFKVDEYATSDIFDQIKFFDTRSDKTVNLPFNLDNKMFYHYEGSLTTPPCTENVNWFVYTNYLPIRKNNFYRMRAAINKNRANARTVQTVATTRTLQTLGGFCNVLYI